MHDPMTVAHEIKLPWWTYRPWPKKHRNSLESSWVWEHRMTDAERAGRSRAWENGYRETFITIWHVDPERDGSDDSCGFCFPRLTKEQIKKLHNVAWSEGQNPYFLRYPDKQWLGTRAEAEAIYRGLVLLTADALRIKLTFDQAARYAAKSIHNPDCCDTANQLCFLPGYHTNFPDATEESDKLRRQERLAGIMGGIARELLRDRRPWYRHARWHFWHWKVQVHAILHFKRWAFSKCDACGKGFKWGEAPVSGQWDSEGPKWFRSEKNIHHVSCSKSQVGQVASATG